MRLVVAASCLASTFAFATLPAQQRAATTPTAALYGSVLSDPGDVPVPNAEVTIAPDRVARTSATGDFLIRGIPPGTYLVTVRHLGHKAITTPLTFAAGDSLGRDFVLDIQPPELDTGRVVAARNRAPDKMSAYEDRRHRHQGDAIDSATIEKESYRSLDQLISAHLLASIVRYSGSAAIASQRGPAVTLSGSEATSGDAADQSKGSKNACYSQVFLDGMRVYSPAPGASLFDLTKVDVTSLAAIEYFRGPAQTPPIYGGTGANCGTLLLWTK
jgi:carboxypeptidase family protein